MEKKVLMWFQGIISCDMKVYEKSIEYDAFIKRIQCMHSFIHLKNQPILIELELSLETAEATGWVKKIPVLKATASWISRQWYRQIYNLLVNIFKSFSKFTWLKLAIYLTEIGNFILKWGEISSRKALQETSKNVPKIANTFSALQQ